jgi:hypothetical protein
MNKYKYGYQLDETNRIVALIGEPELSGLPYIELDVEMSDFKLGEYELINNEIIFVGLKQSQINMIKKEENEYKILELKKQLETTDYKVIKCYEAQLLNEEMPYNLQELLAQRKAWREEINALEFEISMLG